MKQQILLITPPFTQLNTPYPATPYLKGFLNTIGISSDQLDLGIETILALFSKKGLQQLFELPLVSIARCSPNAQRIFNLRDEYINTVDAVITFLQNHDHTLAHLICQRNFLPEASKFELAEDLEWAFGSMGSSDQARHIATLYLEDLSDFIIECVDPHFGFSRYAERLAMSAATFDNLYEELKAPPTLIVELMLDILELKINHYNPNIICLSIPFPGNVFSAFKCAQWLKKTYPNIPLILGGGYANTELRSLSDHRVFQFMDFITLDDGETPLITLLNFLQGGLDVTMLKRTFTLIDNQVVYCNGSLSQDVKQTHVGTPDYGDLPLKKYLSVIQLTNPMHRLWSDGRWNKLTMAHGCYWGKCTFCDISLDYIKNYEANSATTIVDRMETLIKTTGDRGFHFVDEAAPPALMKAISIEILKRKLIVTWWANIRFEKSFNYDLCRLLAASGCVAVSGGLEVASDRLLELIDKGVTIEQVAVVNQNFNKAGIMVHAYLMYGFPTQTAQETVDSLEVVRQMFETGILQSAFWHRFTATAHSPVGMFPEKFNVQIKNKMLGVFANNDLIHDDPTGCDHDQFSYGLKKSLYNYMHEIGLNDPLQNWFDHNIPDTMLPKHLILSHLEKPRRRQTKASHSIIWLGGPVRYNEDAQQLEINTKQEVFLIPCESSYGHWLCQALPSLVPSELQAINFQALGVTFNEKIESGDFTLFWHGTLMEQLKDIGLLVL